MKTLIKFNHLYSSVYPLTNRISEKSTVIRPYNIKQEYEDHANVLLSTAFVFFLNGTVPLFTIDGKGAGHRV